MRWFAVVVLFSVLLPAQQFKPNRWFPAQLQLSGDWYSLPVGRSDYRLRTNHTLARISIRFTNTRQFGLSWDTTRIQFPTLVAGAFAWRLGKGPSPGVWHLAEPILPQQTLARFLDPANDYTFELLTTSPPIAAPGTPSATTSMIERFRDFAGVQGYFMDLKSVDADPGVIWLPPRPAPFPEMQVLILGDSLADGLVPFNAAGAAHPYGALVSWPRRAVELACSLLPNPRTPRFINHSFRGWWGCELALPYMGYPTEQAFRMANPWAQPRFDLIFDRSHLYAPPFVLPNPELIIYQLAQNDTLTGRLANPAAYRQDIVNNITMLRVKWPNAKILVAATHLSTPLGLTQRQEMLAAMNLLSYRTDSKLDFVDTGAILDVLGLSPQPAHPLSFIHDVWTYFIGMQLYWFLQV